MSLIMREVLIMNFGGFLVNPHYLHTLLRDVIKIHYEPPKFIMSISYYLLKNWILFLCTVLHDAGGSTTSNIHA